MKTLTLFICLLLTVNFFAQDKTYVHEATAANIQNNWTIIDHPDLNNNPNANIVFSHLFNGTLNNNINGLWYNGTRWTIYNEDFNVDMEVGTAFVIFIADNAVVFDHVASVANQGTSNSNTLLDHPLLNGENPGPIAILSNYYNPNNVYNNNNYGFTFDTTLFNNRLIYNESFTPIPTNVGFKVMVIPTGGLPGVNTFGHLTSAANTSGPITTLDNEAINNNPDAAFVFSHYFGAFGAPSNNNINTPVGAVYEPAIGRWQIYTENLSAMPLGVAFDIVIAEQEILSTPNNEIGLTFSVYPNPASDILKIIASIEINTVEIISITGRSIQTIEVGGTSKSLSISSLASGMYFLKATSGSKSNIVKFIKK